MSENYMKELLRVAVAQVCQTIGYSSTQSAPLELLQDILDKFLKEFTRDLRRHVEHYNRTEPNLDDVTLTLNSINVNLSELLDFINNVEPVPFAIEVPKFPARKTSFLNFLKPGSKEVLTRPVHIHDHFPPMLPPEIDASPAPQDTMASNGHLDIKPNTDNMTSLEEQINNSDSNKSLVPTSTLDKPTLQTLLKPQSLLGDGERPTREVSSVVMTTGGYISPAVEGKMPEAMVPDIIDKLLGLDAPPPPPPPPPPPVSRPVSRAATSTPIPPVETAASADTDKETKPAIGKESKKTMKNSDISTPNRKSDMSAAENSVKKEKLHGNRAISGSGEISSPANFSKKSFLMLQNAGIHNPQATYANMLLKKAKKQKPAGFSGQHGPDKQHMNMKEKLGKIDPADKTHKKYMKMLQKMAKQGKIPPELLPNIMGPDKKSKMINPSIVASMPLGPERLQLEKLLRKQVKQKQKLIKQQMILEAQAQKHSKKAMLQLQQQQHLQNLQNLQKQQQLQHQQQQPPPLVPIVQHPAMESLVKPLAIDLGQEQKLKPDSKDLSISPVKSAMLTPRMITPPAGTMNLPDSLMQRTIKTPIMTADGPIEVIETPQTLTDGKDAKTQMEIHKLSTEPDRSKLNIFKKISKQKTPKSNSPTPALRIPSMTDAPIINLPSGTTITPTPGPATSTMGVNPLPSTSFPSDNLAGLMNPLKDKVAQAQSSVNPNDFTMMNRVFGEKAGGDVEMVNKPKKRGRKPGSKNAPKIPGAFPPSLLKKNKKLKMDPNFFAPQFGPLAGQLPPEFAAAAAAAVAAGNLSFDNVSSLFPNLPLNPMEWQQKKQMQQHMLMMASGGGAGAGASAVAGAKERKEYKKKTKLLKQQQDLFKNIANATDNAMGNHPLGMVVPTNEEVLNINKKLMRMDTILKPTSGLSPKDLSVDTSLITGKKLPSPALFPLPQTNTAPQKSTSPLKSPGSSKRLMSGMDALPPGLPPSFMLANRPSFPNLNSNMLSMLQFPFPPRPGLIPTPGLFPNPALASFQSNPKTSLLPGLFPYLKNPPTGDVAKADAEDVVTKDKKKSADANLNTGYCNVAPLVPEFLKLTKDSESISSKQSESHFSETDLPKTPKPRNLSSSQPSGPTTPQDHILLKKISETHTPDTISVGSKSTPSTPGGISQNTFEQLMKKNEFTPKASNLSMSSSQETGLDFSINKKSSLPTMMPIKNPTPITINNEPIEVSDDSDEYNQPQQLTTPVINTTLQTKHQQSSLPKKSINSNFGMDEMFVSNTGLPPSTFQTAAKPIAMDGLDLSAKDTKKIKKVKKSSSLIGSSLIASDKTEGVGKLAGGADLIPLLSTGMAYSAKNIPFNSLTANANTTFGPHITDFSTALGISTTVPPSSAVTAAPLFMDNVTITAAAPSTNAASSNIFDLQKKKSKEHKKLKKLKEFKEGKIKKKKDKKDKSKSKEKAEKYLQQSSANSSPAKEKPLISSLDTIAPADKLKDIKKLKKEKKKEKYRSSAEEPGVALKSSTKESPSKLESIDGDKKHKSSPSSSSSGNDISISHTRSPSPIQDAVQQKNTRQELAPTSGATNSTPTVSALPKLTLKLSSTPTPPIDDQKQGPAILVAASPEPSQQREPSPELARISPLVTRPPKQKLNTSGDINTNIPSTSTSISSSAMENLNESSAKTNSVNATTSAPSMIVPPPSPWLSGGTISASSVLLPHQLLQTSKQQQQQQHDTTTAGTSTSAVLPSHSVETTKAQNSTTDRQSPLTLITETSRPSSYIDAEGNRVWICPACGKVDDGSPMIGCDGCDAWYHWVCVGIFVAPKDNEDWFCRVCITRKKGLHSSDKKRKKNKKK